MNYKVGPGNKWKTYKQQHFDVTIKVLYDVVTATFFACKWHK